jgi:hypothetical protein
VAGVVLAAGTAKAMARLEPGSRVAAKVAAARAAGSAARRARVLPGAARAADISQGAPVAVNAARAWQVSRAVPGPACRQPAKVLRVRAAVAAKRLRPR